MRWTSHRFTFIADSDVTELGFRDTSTTSSSIDLFLDHVRLASNTEFVAAAMLPLRLSSAQESMVSPASGEMGPVTLTGAPGDFRVGMFVPSNGNYILERSWDLHEWQRAGEVHADGPRLIEFEDRHVPSLQSGRVFYRIGRLPDE